MLLYRHTHTGAFLLRYLIHAVIPSAGLRARSPVRISAYHIFGEHTPSRERYAHRAMDKNLKLKRVTDGFFYIRNIIK